MSEWMKNLVGYLLVVSVALQMLPNKKYEQYLRLFTGFLLMILMLQPILKIGSADSFLETQIRTFIQEQEALEEKIVRQGEAFGQKTKQQELSETQVEIEPVEQIQVEVGVE